ncbi:MAG: NRDE family protein [Peptococcaceae bacterium]|nr:NRDE family protein [Peptococcaceae bacterium]
MCLILMAYDCHPEYFLVVAANRDEFYARPAARAHFWEEHPDVLAGKDLERSGTWLGITRRGRFAAVTNYRDPASFKRNARSRGLPVREYLCSLQDPPGFIAALDGQREEYNGFNLLLLDGRSMWYYSSRTGSAGKLGPGVYGLSNHLLDTPWPKVVKGKEGLDRILREPGEDLAESLFDLLSDRERAGDGDLPRTGVSLEWERMLSPIFIQSETYGTRGSTVLLADRRGRVRFYERAFGPGGAREGGDAVYEFDLGSEALGGQRFG